MDLNLGHIITTPQKRDAIHVAVAPVEAMCRLAPGEHVAMSSNHPGLVHPVGPFRTAIGVVDPFLRGPVFQGERFWLFLYPKTTQNLRHDWDHPAFPAATTQAAPEAIPGDNHHASMKWLENYVRKHCSNDQEDSDGGLAKFLAYVEKDRWIYYHGDDCHSLGDVEDAEALFHHLGIVMGRKIDASYFEAFTCSC